MRSLFSLVSALVVLIMLMNCSFWLEGVSALSGADQDEVVKDLFHKLSTGSVVVFAAGHVSGQMTLFISGLGGKTDFNGGYQVTVKDDPADGRFSVDSALMLTSKYTPITGAEVMFVCQDSDGSSSLVTMSQDKVGALNLGQNKFTKLNISSKEVIYCYSSGKLHLSTTEAKTYYRVDQSSGKVEKFALYGDTINSAIACNLASTKKFGNLCKIGEDKITLSSSCSGSPPANIISGYVGSGTAYLFDGDNAVYYFDASVFAGEKTVDMKKVEKKDAWQSSGQAGGDGSSQKPPKPPTEGTGSNPALIAIIVILGLLLLLIAIGVTLYCCLLSPEKDAKKTKMMTTTTSKGKAGKGKKESKTKSKAPFSPSSAKGSKRKSSRSPDSKKKSSSKQK